MNIHTVFTLRALGAAHQLEEELQCLWIQPLRRYKAGGLLWTARPIRSDVKRSAVRIVRFGKAETSAARTKLESGRIGTAQYKRYVRWFRKRNA